MSKEDLNNKLSSEIKEIRKFLGISSTELAYRSGLSLTHISHFETGSRLPSLKNLIALAEGLGVSLDRLVYGRKK